jgi:hypothetical protein
MASDRDAHRLRQLTSQSPRSITPTLALLKRAPLQNLAIIDRSTNIPAAEEREIH